MANYAHTQRQSPTQPFSFRGRSSHPSHRQRAATAIIEHEAASSLQAIVESQTAVGITTGHVRDSLMQMEPSSFMIPQDIANIRSNSRRRDLSTRTTMKLLLERLQTDGLYYRREVEPDSQR
ncbi:hypothetical protein F444_22403 [Phytophthora nicotianae P1976]|uniref:Uncharacterized protein n=1 Tax=Phytophthora nicotianae P1976 TaxID=1317066 RepID=A0A080YXW4_PHYNI|nr:hypothetical protein F444_22403 [Phytophthora nicotianae P1976]